MAQKLRHQSVLMNEILSFVPKSATGQLLDVTAGGGGHFFEILRQSPGWSGECWDRDPLAESRLKERATSLQITNEWRYRKKTFGAGPESKTPRFDFILADIGISSFQIDDPARGMSLFSTSPVDFRMDPGSGPDFWDWVKSKSQIELEEIFEVYGEEPKAKKLAEYLAVLPIDRDLSAAALADEFKRVLKYGSDSRIHPATRAFQALRIAINDELGELKSFLAWAPQLLTPGGRLAVISFHSLEDRWVKKAFQDLAAEPGFVILTKKPLVPTAEEEAENPRSRSSKLRVLERKG